MVLRIRRVKIKGNHNGAHKPLIIRDPGCWWWEVHDREKVGWLAIIFPAKPGSFIPLRKTQCMRVAFTGDLFLYGWYLCWCFFYRWYVFSEFFVKNMAEKSNDESIKPGSCWRQDIFCLAMLVPIWSFIKELYDLRFCKHVHYINPN